MDDIERFKQRYTIAGAAALLTVEMAALGTDYSATAYTTRTQADEMGTDLGLGPGRLLLDVGSGCGWPGLYLADKLGCSVISLDLAVEGGRAASQRAAVDGLSERSWSVQASAEAIPLRPRSVDAIVHADVLC